MGSSDADRVKLHFEIRRQGKPVDPVALPAGALTGSSRRGIHPAEPGRMLVGSALFFMSQMGLQRPSRLRRQLWEIS